MSDYKKQIDILETQLKNAQAHQDMLIKRMENDFSVSGELRETRKEITDISMQIANLQRHQK